MTEEVPGMAERTGTVLSFRSSGEIPLTATCSTVPGKSRVKRRLEPPPITMTGWGSAAQSKARRSASSVTSTYRAQCTCIRKVFRVERS